MAAIHGAPFHYPTTLTFSTTFSNKYPLLGGHSTIYMYEIVSLFKFDTVNLKITTFELKLSFWAAFTASFITYK